jgi:hypothetical protein
MVVDDSLSDEIRVTVIATGFNKTDKLSGELKAPKAAARAGFEPIDFETLDKPTYLRKKRDEEANPASPIISKPSKSNVYTIDDEMPEEPDDLDTPTFLRKQMD